MDMQEEKSARRTVVNIITREHRQMVEKRVSAAMALAGKEASFAVYKAHVLKETEGEIGFGPNFSDHEREIKYLKESLDRAQAAEKVTAQAMEYVMRFFLDQLEAVEKA